MEFLKVVYARHNEWLAIVKSFGWCQFPEDIVADMYLELTKEIPVRRLDDKRVNPKYSGLTAEERAVDENGNINNTYLWIMLRKCYAKSYNESKKSLTTNVGEGFEFIVDEVDNGREEAFNNYRAKLEEEVYSWHHYDTMLFMAYLDGKEKNETSLRKLSKETTIPLSSIVNTLNNCKKRLIENVKDEYLDYLNGDYELIK
jgi:hypothetical protein